MNSQSIPENVPNPSGPTEPTAALQLVPTTKEQPKAITIDRTFGQVDVLSAAEQTRLLTCEAVISTGWQNFVDVGLALAQVQDEELYRADFDSFETYCRAKWEYGRHYVSRLISAAQVFRHLETICHQNKPERESQVRPLVGLPVEQTQVAWNRAVEKAGGRKITARLVKSAMHELNLAPPPKPVSQLTRQSKAEKQRLIDSGFGELLVLLSQKAAHETLTAKLEALHAQVRALFVVARPTAAQPSQTA